MEILKNKLLKRLIIYTYIFFSIFTQQVIASAKVVDQNRNQQVNVEKAPNGVPIVNINAPNKNGVSHNYFKEYNVGKEGVLLNNSSKENNRTQLGGIIQGNSNLKGREADVILTEVTGVNRSNIEGYTEVVGKSAEYILANPNGIYLNGAGFINTPRVILTTGKSITDEFGDLKGFDIDDGTVVVGSQGIDGKNVRMVDIVSRTAELNGAVYGGEEVNVVLGRNEYNHETGEVKAKAEKDGDKPKVALDAKALGSIYAGRIYLQSTEKGVGVNSQGEMLAGSGDLEIDVNGDLILKDAQAKNDIKINAENVKIQEKAIAENNINIKSKDIVNTGNISSNKNIEINSSNIESKGNISSKNINISNKEKIVNTGKISADNVTITSKDMENKELAALNADITLSGNLKNESLKAVENLKIKGKNIENTGTIAANKKVKIESTNLSNKGNISGNDIEIKSENNILNEKNIISSSINISSKFLYNNGLIQADVLTLKMTDYLENNGSILGKIATLNASQISNRGIIYGENYLTLVSSKYINEGSGIITGGHLFIDGVGNNAGDISGEKLVISGEKIKNSGNITGEDTLTITADLNNSGTVQGKNLVNIIGNIDNSQNIKSEKELNISGNIINTGYIYSENAEITGNINNNGDILSLLNMKIIGNIINNKNISSGSKLTLLSDSILNNDRISALELLITGTRLINNGIIISDTGIFNIYDLENSGTVYGKKGITISGNKIVNTALIQSSNNLYLISKNIINKGDIFSGNNMDIISQFVNNSGRIIGDGDLKFDTDNSVENSSLIQGNNITIKEIDNSGKLIAKGSIKASKAKNTGTISALKNFEGEALLNFLFGKLILGENMSLEKELLNEGIITVKGDIAAENVSNTGSIISDKDIRLKELDNSNGTIEGRNIDIENTEALNNQSGDIRVFDNDSVLSIQAENIYNTDGRIQSQGQLELNIFNSFTLEGNYIGNNLLKITTESLAVNTDIENNGDIVLNLTGDFLNNSKFVGGNNLTINAVNLINNKILGSTKSFTVNLSGKLSNFNNIVLGNGNNTITTGGSITNNGILTSQNNLDVNSKELINNGQIASGNILILNAESILNGNYSLIYSKDDMTISLKEDFINNKGEIFSGNNIEIKTLGKVQNNAGIIESMGDIYIEAVQIENLGEIVEGSTVIEKGFGAVENMSEEEKNRIKDKFLSLINEATEENSEKYGKVYFNSSSLGWEDEYTNKMAYISSGKNVTLKTTGDVINRGGNISADRDINISAYRLINGNFPSSIGDYEDKAAETDKRTKISAGNNINISAIQVGDGILTKEENTVNEKIIDMEQIILNSSDVERTGTINTESCITIPEEDKELFVVNKDLIDSKDISIDFKEKIDVEDNEISSINNSISTEKNPKFKYLIETNLKFIDMSYYLGSDYLFEKIGYNPEKDIKLLGDSFYESRIVNRAILENTGKRYLNGAINDREQMQILLDNSIKAMEDLNLSIGVALTKEQINNLKNDIIWYVEEEVNGIKVLVPKIYLSKKTLASLEKFN
mgnify:FL=1